MRITLFIALFFIYSCGKETASTEEIQFQQGLNKLNSESYTEANAIFESLVINYPENNKYKRYYADTFLGMGNFELIPFLIKIQNLLAQSFNSQDFLNEAILFAQKYFYSSKVKKSYILRALNIYADITEDKKGYNAEENLKQGLINVFLLVREINDISKTSENNSDYKELYERYIKKYVTKIDSILLYGFSSYIYLKESYSEIQGLISETDNIIFKLYGENFNEIRDDLKNMSLEKFFRLFLKYNPSLAAKISKDLFETCEKKEAVKRVEYFIKTLNENEDLPLEVKLRTIKLGNEILTYLGRLNENYCTFDDFY